MKTMRMFAAAAAWLALVPGAHAQRYGRIRVVQMNVPQYYVPPIYRAPGFVPPVYAPPIRIAPPVFTPPPIFDPPIAPPPAWPSPPEFIKPPVNPDPPRPVYALPPMMACIIDNDDSCNQRMPREYLRTFSPMKLTRAELRATLDTPTVDLSRDQRRQINTAQGELAEAESLLKKGRFQDAARKLRSAYDRIKDVAEVPEETKRGMRTWIASTDAHAALANNDISKAAEMFEQVPSGDSPAERQAKAAALMGIVRTHIQRRWFKDALAALEEAASYADEPDSKSWIKMMTGNTLAFTREYDDPGVVSNFREAIDIATGADQISLARIYYASSLAQRREISSALEQLDDAESVCGGEAWDRGCAAENKEVIETYRRAWR